MFYNIIIFAIFSAANDDNYNNNNNIIIVNHTVISQATLNVGIIYNIKKDGTMVIIIVIYFNIGCHKF